MAVRIVSKSNAAKADGQSQYQGRLLAELRAAGVAAEWHTLAQWKAGTAKGDPSQDFIIVAAEDAGQIQADYAVIGVQYTCWAEHGLRCRSKEHLALGRMQSDAAKRGRTLWVACSDWAAYHCRLHAGVRADRIIYGGVDIDTFIPSERQRTRSTKRPVVLHHATHVNKGHHLLAGLEKALGGAFELRELRCEPHEVPEAMRQADIWLSLSASSGLPTTVLEAMSCGLIVVGTNVGVLWSATRGTPLHDGPFLGWLNKEVGAVVFDWQQRDYPEAVAAHLRAAWKHRKALGNGREHARRWWSLETFGRKWLEALWLAGERFGVAGAPPAPQVVDRGRLGEHR